MANRQLHERRVMREAIGNILRNETDCKERVYISRPTPAFQNELPAIFIYTKTDDSKPRAKTQHFLERTLHVTVEIQVNESNQIDNEIDFIAMQIEDLILLNTFLKDPNTGEQVAHHVDIGETQIELVSEGGDIFGAGIIQLDIKYQTDVPTSTQRVGDFKKMGVTYPTKDSTADTAAASDLVQIQP